MTLGGTTFSVPKGYVPILQSRLANSALLFYGKYKEGVVVVVPAGPVDEKQMLKDIIETGLITFFPKESQAYDWRRSNNHRKLSKFEVFGEQSMGFNKKSLVLISSHHFRFAEKDIFISDLSKWDNGHEEEVFAGLGAESMQGCNSMVEIIYSITGEKIDATNAPCELVALTGSEELGRR